MDILSSNGNILNLLTICYYMVSKFKMLPFELRISIIFQKKKATAVDIAVAYE